MKRRTLAIVLGFAVLSLAPLAAQEAAGGEAVADAGVSEEDIFGAEESVAVTTEQTQDAAPRDDLLTSAAPWITGSYTGRVALSWDWSDVWGTAFDLLNPTRYGLSQSSTAAKLGFVARPDKDISVTGQLRTSYPFVKEIEAVTATTPTVVTTTYTVADLQVWSLYSKFSWNDALFLTFGKQPVRWGTGYFFSPADDIFAQSEVDINDPTAEREGPLALRVHYPIPRTMHNLYAYAVLPRSTDLAALAAMKPEDIAVAAKAELFFGNTEAAIAGYYQQDQRPRVVLMATTGNGEFNFFGEGLVAFPSTTSEAFIQAGAVSWGTFPVFTSDYTVVDRKTDTLFQATGGVSYSNQDWNFTAVGQYLYNGAGYASLSLGDILQAALDRAVSQPAGEPTLGIASLAGTLGGLGKIGQHYGVLYLGWSELWDSKWDFSVLAIENFSDWSGYVKPIVSFTFLNYVKLSAAASFSWGPNGSEFADPSGLASAMSTGTIATFVAKPTLSLSLTADIGSVSF
jgi:hypothetical protein